MSKVRYEINNEGYGNVNPYLNRVTTADDGAETRVIGIPIEEVVETANLYLALEVCWYCGVRFRNFKKPIIVNGIVYGHPACEACRDRG